MQVTDDAPGPAERLQTIGEGAGKVRPGGRRAVGGQAFDQLAASGEQGFDGRLDVFGLNGVETWQVGEIEQGIGSRHFYIPGKKNGRSGRPSYLGAEPLFYKLAVGMPRGMAENRHDQDQAEEQGGETKQGHGDEQGRP